jgi:hypothetical protein
LKNCLVIVLLIFINVTYCGVQNSYNYSNFDGAKALLKLTVTDNMIDPELWKDAWDNASGLNSEALYVSYFIQLYKMNKDKFSSIRKIFAESLIAVDEEYIIQTMITFVQSIPYKIPPMEYKGYKTGGILLPGLCLQDNYADCDSRCLLLSCLASDLSLSVIVLFGSDHAFIGVEGKPGKKDEYVEVENKTYLLCELTSKWSLGEIPLSSYNDINSGKYQYFILE